MIRTLTLATDLMVREGASTLEDRGDHLILRTPEEPDFWFGNAVILQTAPDGADAHDLVALHKGAFPEAGHVCLQWDVPNLTLPEDLAAQFRTEGFDIETSDALSLTRPLAAPPVPEGLKIRQLDGHDWQQALDLAMEIGVEEGYDPANHADYLRRVFDGHRRRMISGAGAWFGAFDGDLLVAQMGIYLRNGLARFQNVETRASHRRRGICAALLGQTGGWALARDPQARLIIVAEADSAAGRLYRRAGFSLAETTVSAVRGSYASGRKAAVT